MNTLRYFWHALKYWAYRKILLPRILDNYRQRELGLQPDQWYWADRIAVQLGFCTAYDGSQTIGCQRRRVLF